jgi:hypothetical protein
VRREGRSDSGVRDVVDTNKSRPETAMEFEQLSRATTLDIQHLRSPALASRRHKGIIIADAARDRPSRLISCGEAERHRKVREGVGGSRDPSGQSLQRVRENRKGRRRDGWGGGGEGRYLWSSRKAAGLSRARLPQLGSR